MSENWLSSVSAVFDPSSRLNGTGMWNWRDKLNSLVHVSGLNAALKYSFKMYLLLPYAKSAFCLVLTWYVLSSLHKNRCYTMLFCFVCHPPFKPIHPSQPYKYLKPNENSKQKEKKSPRPWPISVTIGWKVEVLVFFFFYKFCRIREQSLEFIPWRKRLWGNSHSFWCHGIQRDHTNQTYPNLRKSFCFRVPSVANTELPTCVRETSEE